MIFHKKTFMAVPIWKDYYVTLSGVYRIMVEETGDVIYTGNAQVKPGGVNTDVRINDICADYLQHVLPTLNQAEFTRINTPTFKVQLRVQGAGGYEWVDLYSVQFLNDWSYDYDFDPATMGLSFPINGVVDPRMPIVWTGYEVSEVDATIYLRDGTSFQVLIPVEITADFNNDFNEDFSLSVRSAGSGTAVFFPSAWGDVVRIEVNNSTFILEDTCARYALYYVNAHGGWDSFLIEGNTLEADTLTRHTREVVYDNRNITNRGIHNYVNEITKGFTFHTGWLTGDQGERMHHLINSTDVYMYDIAKQQMIPVTIPTTSCEYKTYKNQGNRLVNYTIQVEIAQNRIRR